MVTNVTISALGLGAVAEGGRRGKERRDRGGGRAASVVTVLLDHKLIISTSGYLLFNSVMLLCNSITLKLANHFAMELYERSYIKLSLLFLLL